MENLEGLVFARVDMVYLDLEHVFYYNLFPYVYLGSLFILDRLASRTRPPNLSDQ